MFMAKARRVWMDVLVYLAVRLLAMVMQMFPIDVNLRTARFMGWVWYHIMPRHRERARAHLRMAYQDALSPTQVDRLALESMQQMVMMAVEALFTPRLINEWTWNRYVRLKGMAPLVEELLSDRGVILLTAHYGNWELLGFVMTALGFPATAVMRPLDNPYLNEHLLKVRRDRGLMLLDKRGATESADQVLDDGETLCFIADQNAGRKGEFVDFFGVKASTYKSIALLAIRHRVPIIVGYARRLSERFEYEAGCTRMIRPEEWEGRDNEIHWITQEYTRAIEQFVREAPEQYLWMHRRWKSRPRGEKAEENPVQGHAASTRS
jgi:KDO2-lipid IV(A) lauroyltransferase